MKQPSASVYWHGSMSVSQTASKFACAYSLQASACAQGRTKLMTEKMLLIKATARGGGGPKQLALVQLFSMYSWECETQLDGPAELQCTDRFRPRSCAA